MLQGLLGLYDDVRGDCRCPHDFFTNALLPLDLVAFRIVVADVYSSLYPNVRALVCIFCMFVWMYVCVRARVRSHVNTYLCVCVCVCLCLLCPGLCVGHIVKI